MFRNLFLRSHKLKLWARKQCINCPISKHSLSDLVSSEEQELLNTAHVIYIFFNVMWCCPAAFGIVHVHMVANRGAPLDHFGKPPVGHYNIFSQYYRQRQSHLQWESRSFPTLIMFDSVRWCFFLTLTGDSFILMTLDKFIVHMFQDPWCLVCTHGHENTSTYPICCVLTCGPLRLLLA